MRAELFDTPRIVYYFWKNRKEGIYIVNKKEIDTNKRQWGKTYELNYKKYRTLKTYFERSAYNDQYK